MRGAGGRVCREAAVADGGEARPPAAENAPQRGRAGCTPAAPGWRPFAPFKKLVPTG
jgi:hypothetical protein